MVQSLYKRMDSWTQGGAPYWTFCREAQRGETGRNREERKSVREKQCKNMTNGYIKTEETDKVKKVFEFSFTEISGHNTTTESCLGEK